MQRGTPSLSQRFFLCLHFASGRLMQTSVRRFTQNEKNKPLLGHPRRGCDRVVIKGLTSSYLTQKLPFLETVVNGFQFCHFLQQPRCSSAELGWAKPNTLLREAQEVFAGGGSPICASRQIYRLLRLYHLNRRLHRQFQSPPKEQASRSEAG